MTRLLDGGHLGELFRIALAERLPGHRPEHLAGLLEAYRNHEPALALFDDASWALGHFAARAKLGLITDGTHHVQAKKVAALGIAPHFQEIVYTHALGGRAFSKPHPRSYEMIEQALAAEGSRLVYVGDNPSKDFIVPNARGWTSVMVERPAGPAHPRRRSGGGRRRAAAHDRISHRAARAAAALNSRACADVTPASGAKASAEVAQ